MNMQDACQAAQPGTGCLPRARLLGFGVQEVVVKPKRAGRPWRKNPVFSGNRYLDGAPVHDRSAAPQLVKRNSGVSRVDVLKLRLPPPPQLLNVMMFSTRGRIGSQASALPQRVSPLGKLTTTL